MLYVRDLARMREFYANVLQAGPINTEWTETWAFFNAGGAGFGLHAIPAKDAGGSEPPSPSPKREQSPVKLIFAVKDVPTERERLTALRITVLQRAWQEPAESFDCVDPEGNIFQIAARSHLSHLFGLSTGARQP